VNRFKSLLFVCLAISFVFLTVVTFSLWADYWNACGARGRVCGTQEASAAGATEGLSVAGATQGGTIKCASQGSTAAHPVQAPSAGETMLGTSAGCATHGGSADCATKCAVAGKQAGTAACPMQGGSAAGATHGAATACAMHEGSGSGAGPIKQGQGTAAFLKPYFEMRNLLANDKVKGLDNLSRNLGKETGKLRKSLAKANAPSEQLDALKDIENAASVMKTNNLKSAREGFKGLSRSFLTYVKSYGCEVAVYSFYCDMVKESWLQETNKIGNPYYGSQMLKCGVMTGHTTNGEYVMD